MQLNTLLAIDTAFTLYMGKVMGSPTDPKLFPSAKTLHALTYKLLSKAERNFVEKRVVDGVWDQVPAGMGSIWNLTDTLEIANYCVDNMDKIHVANATELAQAYESVIENRKSTRGKPAKLCSTHLVPELQSDTSLNNYPVAVLKWIDRRFQYVMPPVLKYMKELGVPCPSAQHITVAEWDELTSATFETLDDKALLSTADAGGELNAFAEMSKAKENQILKETDGDEHIALFASDFTGTYYLDSSEAVESAKAAQRILTGYWDLFGHCDSQKQADEARQSFLFETADGINSYIDTITDQQKGAGIVILD